MNKNLFVFKSESNTLFIL